MDSQREEKDFLVAICDLRLATCDLRLAIYDLRLGIYDLGLLTFYGRGWLFGDFSLILVNNLIKPNERGVLE
jgi:hypothetical protein